MEKQGKLSLEPPFRYISLAIYFQVKAFKPSGNLVVVPFFDPLYFVKNGSGQFGNSPFKKKSNFPLH